MTHASKRGLKHANEDHDDCEMAQCAGGERREGVRSEKVVLVGEIRRG